MAVPAALSAALAPSRARGGQENSGGGKGGGARALFLGNGSEPLVSSLSGAAAVLALYGWAPDAKVHAAKAASASALGGAGGGGSGGVVGFCCDACGRALGVSLSPLGASDADPLAGDQGAPGGVAGDRAQAGQCIQLGERANDEACDLRESESGRPKRRRGDGRQSAVCPESSHRAFCPWIRGVGAQDGDAAGLSGAVASWRLLLDMLPLTAEEDGKEAGGGNTALTFAAAPS